MENRSSAASSENQKFRGKGKRHRNCEAEKEEGGNHQSFGGSVFGKKGGGGGGVGKKGNKRCGCGKTTPTLEPVESSW